jgi:S1-C subfamily serine protease
VVASLGVAGLGLGGMVAPATANLATTNLTTAPWNYSVNAKPFQVPAVPASAGNLDAKGIFRRSMPSVVMLVNPAGGLGSGVVIDRAAGLILTNDHVVRGGDAGPQAPVSPEVAAIFADGKTGRRATVLRTNFAYDVALLKLEGPIPANVISAPLCHRNTTRPGERIFVLGNPSGYAFSISQATVSALPKEWTLNMLKLSEFLRLPASRVLQIDGFVNGGNSGGPVINQRGEVVSLVSYGSTTEDRLNYTIPIGDALSALKVRVTPNGSPATACGNPN